MLLLRLSLAATALLAAYLNPSQRSTWVVLSLCALACSLCLGLLTPIVALLALMLQITLPSSLSVTSANLAVLAFNTLALMLLGPGAYSLDAMRFGRRVIDWPPPDGGAD